MKIFNKVPIILFSIHVCLSRLLSCKETINAVCSKNETYVSTNFPPPFPTNIKISLKFYDIIGVNEADQTVTVVIFKWQDHRLDVNRSQEDINKYVTGCLTS